MSDHWKEYGEIPEDKVIEKAKTLMLAADFVTEHPRCWRRLIEPRDSLLGAIQEYEKDRYQFKRGFMTNIRKKFVPTEYDKTFVKQIVSKLVIGGTWGYKNLPIVFQKTDDKTLALVAAWPEMNPLVDAEIEKTRIVLKACGLKFADLRNGPNPNPIPEKKA